MATKRKKKTAQEVVNEAARERGMYPGKFEENAFLKSLRGGFDGIRAGMGASSGHGIPEGLFQERMPTEDQLNEMYRQPTGGYPVQSQLEGMIHRNPGAQDAANKAIGFGQDVMNNYRLGPWENDRRKKAAAEAESEAALQANGQETEATRKLIEEYRRRFEQNERAQRVR